MALDGNSRMCPPPAHGGRTVDGTWTVASRPSSVGNEARGHLTQHTPVSNWRGPAVGYWPIVGLVWHPIKSILNRLYDGQSLSRTDEEGTKVSILPCQPSHLDMEAGEFTLKSLAAESFTINMEATTCHPVPPPRLVSR